MITIQNVDGAIKFTFSGNSTYLQDGTIEAPLNSLMLVTDSSNMATFKKAATNDIFVSATYDELGMTKDELVTWFEENAVGGTGGGGGDITSGKVQTMIDESISGKVDASSIVSAITSASTDSEIPSAKLVYDIIAEDEEVTARAIAELNEKKLDASAYTPTDLSEYWTSAQTSSAIDAVASGKLDTSTFETYSGDVANELANKLDSSAYTPTDLSEYWTSAQTSSAIDAATSGKASQTDLETVSGQVANKQDTLIAGDNITISGNVISATGGSGGITSGEVQTMIDESVSGKADTSAVTVSETPIFVNYEGSYSDNNGVNNTKYVVLDFGGDKTIATNVYCNIQGRDSNYNWANNTFYLDYTNGTYTAQETDVYYDVVYDSQIEDFKISLKSNYSDYFITNVSLDGSRYIKVPMATIASGQSANVIETSIVDTFGDVYKKNLNNIYSAYFGGLNINELALNAYKVNGEQSSNIVKLDELTIRNNVLKPDIKVGLGTSGWTSFNIDNNCNLNNFYHNVFRISGDTSNMGNWYFTLIVWIGGNQTSDYIQWDGEQNDFILTSQWLSGEATINWDSANSILTVTYPLTSTYFGEEQEVTISTIENGSCQFGYAITSLEYYDEFTQPIKPYVQDLRTDVNTISGQVATKVDSSAVTSSVTSASTDSEIPSAKAVFDAIPTGGTSITVDPSLDSGSTNAVANSAITDAVTANAYPIEGALTPKHFWNDENMGYYTEIDSSSSIKVANSTLLNNPYIAYAFSYDSEFMGGGCGYLATVSNGSITSIDLLNGSSISSLTVTYDANYTYFTPSGNTFSDDGIGIIAVMGMDHEPSSFFDLQMSVREEATNAGIISVIGNIPSERIKQSINRIYDTFNGFNDFNPIADTVTLDDGRNNDGISYGVINYNTYNPLTDTVTSGHTADVFKYSIIDFKSDDNVLTYNGSAISMDSLKHRGAVATISAFTDGSSTTTSQREILFNYDTCFIINTNSASSGGNNQQLSIDISGPNSKSGNIQLQFNDSNGLTVQVSYNEKYNYVSKTINPFVLGNSYIIDTRKFGWGDETGIHTFTVSNRQGSDFISSIKFYSTYNATIPIADIAADVAAGTYATATEMFDELSHVAKEEEVNFYDYGSPSAVTIVNYVAIYDLYGVVISGMSDGFYINVQTDEASGKFIDGLNFNNDGSIVSTQFPHEPIPYYLDDELTKFENGVWNIYFAEGTKANYLSINTTTEASAVIYKSFTETPIKDAVSNIQNSLSGYVATSAITSAVTSASTDSQVPSAKAVFDVIPTVTDTITSGSTDAVSAGVVYAAMGGLKLQQISQADYDALVSGGTVDSSTLYIITNVVN